MSAHQLQSCFDDKLGKGKWGAFVRYVATQLGTVEELRGLKEQELRAAFEGFCDTEGISGAVLKKAYCAKELVKWAAGDGVGLQASPSAPPLDPLQRGGAGAAADAMHARGGVWSHSSTAAFGIPSPGQPGFAGGAPGYAGMIPGRPGYAGGVPGMQAQVLPQMQAQMPPQMQAQMQGLTPQMQAQMQAQMLSQMQAQMTPQMQAQMQAQMSPEVQEAMTARMVAQMKAEDEMAEKMKPMMDQMFGNIMGMHSGFVQAMQAAQSGVSAPAEAEDRSPPAARAVPGGGGGAAAGDERRAGATWAEERFAQGNARMNAWARAR